MKAIMIQGTGSDVGKSVICTAFCRYFVEEGYRVAPFKSQNMALNSYITLDGGEIGRAQGVQAEAARIEATVDMNPILLKPKGDMVSEVIVHGRHYADMKAGEYREHTLDTMLQPVQQSLDRLSQEYEILVIEGAGSPAEINLKDRDIANMRVAHLADAPVILVADIERGGVFATLIGTLELLDPEERARVKGFIINKFRGSKELLDPGIEWLEKRTGIPVLGVLPYMDLHVDPEDSLALEKLHLKGNVRSESDLDIVVIQLPRISNFTDFIPLSNYPDVTVRYVKSVQELGQPDVIILPGTKNTVEDLCWLKEMGLADEILRLYQRGCMVVGICGGYQMLGKKLIDPNGVESSRHIQSGLGLLDLETVFVSQKKTTRVMGTSLVEWAEQASVEGYEIHLGRSKLNNKLSPFIRLSDGSLDGAIRDDGSVWGTYIHGIFDNLAFTHRWINHLRLRKGLPIKPEMITNQNEEREEIYTSLAQIIRKHLDMEKVEKMMGLR